MATAETVQLGLSHPPKEESIKVFNEIEHELKTTLRKTRHDHDSTYNQSPQTNQAKTQETEHEPEYFALVKELSDDQLVNFSSHNFEQVRVGTSAYGIHLFGKISLAGGGESSGLYIFFRAFVAGEADTAKLHSIHTEEKENSDGSKNFRAIFSESDELEWFDT